MIKATLGRLRQAEVKLIELLEPKFKEGEGDKAIALARLVRTISGETQVLTALYQKLYGELSTTDKNGVAILTLEAQIELDRRMNELASQEVELAIEPLTLNGLPTLPYSGGDMLILEAIMKFDLANTAKPE